MKFKYSGGAKSFLPIIPVVLKVGNNELGYYALIDSGADICVVQAEVGKALGLAVTTGKKITLQGIAGAGTAYIHEINLKVGGWEIKNVPVAFSPDMSPTQSFGIMGHQGFFETFKVTFDTKKREVELKFHT